MNKLQPWEDHPAAGLRYVGYNDHFSPSLGITTYQQRMEWERQQGKSNVEAAVFKFYTKFRGRRYDQFGVRYGNSIQGAIE